MYVVIHEYNNGCISLYIYIYIYILLNNYGCISWGWFNPNHHTPFAIYIRIYTYTYIQVRRGHHMVLQLLLQRLHIMGLVLPLPPHPIRFRPRRYRRHGDQFHARRPFPAISAAAGGSPYRLTKAPPTTIW